MTGIQPWLLSRNEIETTENKMKGSHWCVKEE